MRSTEQYVRPIQKARGCRENPPRSDEESIPSSRAARTSPLAPSRNPRSITATPSTATRATWTWTATTIRSCRRSHAPRRHVPLPRTRHLSATCMHQHDANGTTLRAGCHRTRADASRGGAVPPNPPRPSLPCALMSTATRRARRACPPWRRPSQRTPHVEGLEPTPPAHRGCVGVRGVEKKNCADAKSNTAVGSLSRC